MPAERAGYQRSALGERLVVARPDRRAAALHPDADAVARRRPRRLPHHHRRVHRRRPAAAAALAVPRAGRDAGQRGRRRRDRSRLRPDARPRLGARPWTPRASRARWTTPPTAGSGCRRRCGSASATRVRAVSVAEVVSPDRGDVGRWPRDLMVALVRAGVTATCSSADKPAVRRPRRRLEPARRADRARRTRRERLHRSGSGRSRPGLHRGARAPARRRRRRTGVGPGRRAAGATLGARRRPARRRARCRCSIVAGGDGLDAAVGRAGRRPRRRRDRRRPARAAAGSRPSRRAPSRVLNRGVPELRRRLRRHAAHVADAVVHRLAVGDVDRPAAPHRARRLQLPAAALDAHLRLRAWSPATATGATRGLPARSAEFSHPLLGVAGSRDRRRRAAELGLAAGDRARRRGAARRAQGGGQPDGTRQRQHRRPAGAVSRCGWSKRRGRQPTSSSRSGLRSVVGAAARRPAGAAATAEPGSRRADAARLRDRHRADPARTCRGCSTADHVALAPDAEAAQPLYARYWLHNRGPAPLGGLPAVAHLHPQHSIAEPGAECVLRLTAASDCTDSALHGTVRLVCPDGWTASPPSCRSCCPPAGIWRPTSS